MKNRVVNNVILYGYVYQLGSSDKNKLSVKTVKNATSPNFGKEFIAGEIHIAVDEDGLNVIPVRFSYVTAYRKDGKTKNPSYKVLESIIANEAEHCWITAGKENAYKVKLTCSLDVNDFYSQRDEKVVSALQISGSFADFVNVLPEEKDRNRFEADILFNRVKRIEADEERGITEEYAELSGAVFNFRNELLPERFVMKKPDGIEYFESLDISPSEPQFAHCTGAVNCMTIKRERVSESLWGEAQVNTIETKSRQLEILGIQTLYDFGDEENGITADEVKKMMQDREVKLAGVKANWDEYQAKAGESNKPIIPKEDDDGFDF